MSFTVMRYKDGKPAPIKMSIWDAFKGAPSPKPRGKLCPCCHKNHPASKFNEVATIEDKEQKSSDGKPIDTNLETESKAETTDTGAKKVDKRADDKDQDETSKQDGNDKNQGGSHSTRDQETYSKADDEKIISLKAQGKSWKDILAAIGKQSKSQLQDHWKTINPDTKDDRPPGPKETDAKDPANKHDKEPTPEDSGKKKGSGQGKKDKHTNAPDKNSKGEPTPVPSPGLRGWSDRYDRQKWIAAASRHFDLTGQRITAATAKKLAEGK